MARILPPLDRTPAATTRARFVGHVGAVHEWSLASCRTRRCRLSADGGPLSDAFYDLNGDFVTFQCLEPNREF